MELHLLLLIGEMILAIQVGNDSILSDVPAGNYFVRVDDSGGAILYCECCNNRTRSTLSSISNINDVNCAGNSDGAIDINVSGGTLPYAYSWTGPNGFSATSEDIS